MLSSFWLVHKCGIVNLLVLFFFIFLIIFHLDIWYVFFFCIFQIYNVSVDCSLFFEMYSLINCKFYIFDNFAYLRHPSISQSMDTVSYSYIIRYSIIGIPPLNCVSCILILPYRLHIIRDLLQSREYYKELLSLI